MLKHIVINNSAIGGSIVFKILKFDTKFQLSTSISFVFIRDYRENA